MIFMKSIRSYAPFALGLALFLLLGCTGNSQPNHTSAQNNASISNGPNGTLSNFSNPVPLQPVPLPAPEPNCTLFLSPAQIHAGENTTLFIQARLANVSSLYYLCGNQTRQYFASGAVNLSRVCVFDAPGNQTVWVATDNGTCAQAILEVLPAPPAPPSSPPARYGNCSIVSGSRTNKVESNTWTYEATVQYAGYPLNSTLSWDCQYGKFSKGVGIPSPGLKTPDSASGILHINCQYPFYPGSLAALPVFVDGDYCGDILD